MFNETDQKVEEPKHHIDVLNRFKINRVDCNKNQIGNS